VEIDTQDADHLSTNQPTGGTLRSRSFVQIQRMFGSLNP
jgi:hypothetical protein